MSNFAETQSSVVRDEQQGGALQRPERAGMKVVDAVNVETAQHDGDSVKSERGQRFLAIRVAPLPRRSKLLPKEALLPVVPRVALCVVADPVSACYAGVPGERAEIA